MRIGVPTETKADESRVSVMPVGVATLTGLGHAVHVQRGAGLGSGFADHDYEVAGATMADSAREVFDAADLIVKVKEPQPDEIAMFKDGQVVFTYFHFAADRECTLGCRDAGVTAVAYETVVDRAGRLPLLTPMSEIAGKMSVQEGAKYLERPNGGRGVLLGGVPGVAPASVVVLGGGVVGHNAAKVAAGFGAEVRLLDIDLDRLRYLDDTMAANVKTVYSDPGTIAHYCRKADLVIGAVLIPGARAPKLVTRYLLKEMHDGAVVVDVAVDQGGCIETSRPTTHHDPTFVVEGVLHYCVANMPGAVSRTSTFALCNATFPYLRTISQKGLKRAVADDAGLAAGVNLHRGAVTNAAVAAAHDLEHRPVPS